MTTPFLTPRRCRRPRIAAAILAGLALGLAACGDRASEPGGEGIQSTNGSDVWTVAPLVDGSHFHGVHGLAFDAQDRLFVGDVIGQAIYQVVPEAGSATPIIPAPTGEADDLEFGPDGTLAWTSFFAGEVRARRPDGKIVTLAKGHPGFNSLAFAPDGRLFATTVFLGDALYEIDLEGVKPAREVARDFGGLNGFDFGPDGMLYGPLFTKGKVARVDVESGEVTVIAEGFKVPAAVNFNSKGELFVVDTGTGQIFRVDPESGEKTVVAAVAPMIDNLAFDSKDRLFITNAADNAVIEIDVETGRATTHMQGAFSVPGDLALSPDGGHLFIPDIFAFRAVELTNYEVLEVARAFEDELHLPIFVAVNDSYLAVTGLALPGISESVVQLFDRARGRPIGVIKGFESPQGLAFIPGSNQILVLEYDKGQLVRVDPENPDTSEVIAEGLEEPVDIVVAEAGQAYVTEYRSGSVTAFDFSSGERRKVAEGLRGPEGIALFPNGDLAVAEVGRRQILRIDPATGDTEILAKELPIGLAIPESLPAHGIPTGVAAKDDDTLYFTSDLRTALFQIQRESGDEAN